MNVFFQFVLAMLAAAALLAVAVIFAFLKNPAMGMAYVNESSRREAERKAPGRIGRK